MSGGLLMERVREITKMDYDKYRLILLILHDTIPKFFP